MIKLGLTMNALKNALSYSSVPSIRALIAFEATGRLGSTVRASQELNISHSAISRSIRGLETSVNVSLFERKGSGLCLTESGRRIHACVTATLRDLAETFELERKCARRSHLRVSTTSSIAQGWLLPRLAGFLQRYPDVEVEIVGTRDLEDIDKSDIDVVIRMGQGGWALYEMEPLCDDVIYPVCSPRFLDKCQQRIEISDLPAEVFLQDLDPLLDWSRWLAENGIVPPKGRRGLRAHGGELTIDAARRGLGVALARELTVEDDLLNGRLVRAHPGGQIIKNAIWVGGSRNACKKSHVRRFREWLSREVGKSMPAMPSATGAPGSALTRPAPIPQQRPA
ncbi:LysR substrate binding domain protein [Thalassococcus sp. S3]|nr:LysR substrate binding domain protein [Thalassococcus sp. S3]